jgi:hypothetical protein
VGTILWLASFPKSGNTWLRALLANYNSGEAAPVHINRLPEVSFGDMRQEYYSEVAGKPVASLPFAEIQRLRPRVHRLLAGARPGTVMVKTHSAMAVIEGTPAITLEVSRGAVYIARNPLDVAVSFAHHFGLPMDNAIKAIGFPGLRSAPQPGNVAQFFSDWSSHARSWLDSPALKVHLVRYEDLAADPERSLGRVIAFLGVKRDRARLRRAVGSSAFQTLARQEEQAGFVEGSQKGARFFRSGKVGGWRQELTEQQAQSIVGRHRDMMTRLGYIGADGRLAV